MEIITIKNIDASMFKSVRWEFDGI
jgi:hypothetical protein